ncbi:hypothetical protein BDV06DRAFT_233784 [Aspergillus oleicola]
MQSCDICRKRKVKCNRRTPCARCTRLSQPCTYTDILRKKGPKFVHSYPSIYTSTPISLSTSTSTSASTGTLASASGSSEALTHIPMNANIEALIRHADFQGFDSGSGSGTSAASASDFDDELDLDLDLDLDFEFGEIPPDQRLQLEQGHGPQPTSGVTQDLGNGNAMRMEHTMSLYTETLYPLYPVVDIQEIRFGVQFNNGYGATRYALLCSICAAVHAHLASKEAENCDLEPEHSNGNEHRNTCEQYLHAALQAREQGDARHHNCHQHSQNIIIPFFLFLTYWNLGRVRHAWWYLRESVALLISGRLHREDEYRKLEVPEAEAKRFVFWSIFVAERTFCLLRDKPITLRPWISLPHLSSTQHQEILSGFIRQATLFRDLHVDLSGCRTAAGFATPVTFNLATEEAHGHDGFNPNTGLSLPLPLAIQRLEYSVTREWLQAKVWRLGIPGAPQEKQSSEFVASKENGHWRLEEPLHIIKAALGILREYSPFLQSCWSGILDQKLCDICECLCDVQPVMQTRLSGVAAVDLEQILRGLLEVLGTLEGRSAYLVVDALGKFSE